jgi:hypothetical protein
MSRKTKAKPVVKIDKAAVARAVAADVLGIAKPATMEEEVRADLERMLKQFEQQVAEMQKLGAMYAQAQINVASLNSAITYARKLLGLNPSQPENAPKAETPAPGAPVT